MSTQPITSDQAANYAVLVNADRIRSSIKRLFHNRVSEVLGELLQNSQRAGATAVVIATSETSFIVQDNGHGLLGGIDGFHKLLKLAESSFDNPTIEDQDPMGVGIVSLMTHDQVDEVTFASGTLSLTIDTKRWWDANESDYYRNWYRRMETLDEQIEGLRISVTCKPDLVKK
jgi:hypothetical protein